VFENKVKSVGRHAQLDQYRDQGYHVAALALLPESLDAESRKRVPAIHYDALREILSSLSLDPQTPYQFFVMQYRDYLQDTLAVFDLLRSFVRGERRAEFLAEHLKQSAPDLCFGEAGYKEAESEGRNTKWIYEKNMQGPPYMEAIPHSSVNPNRYWTIRDPFASLHESEPFWIAPRLEVWLYPRWLASAQDLRPIGRIMLGTWSEHLMRAIRDTEPYRSVFNPRVPRHFHSEEVSLEHLPFERMAECLRGMLARLYTPR
jgi:hypothetical protein